MYPPRSFCIKDLVPSWCYYFIGWVNKIGWIGSRSVGISSQPGGLSASGSWLCEVMPLSSLFLSTSSASLSLSGYHDVSGSTLSPPQPQQRFSSDRASQLLPDTCETMSLNKCFNFICFFGHLFIVLEPNTKTLQIFVFHLSFPGGVQLEGYSQGKDVAPADIIECLWWPSLQTLPVLSRCSLPQDD